LEKHVLLKKLRDSLESLKGRVAGRNKDDVEDAIAMVSFFFGDEIERYVLRIDFFLINRYSCLSSYVLFSYEADIEIKYPCLYSTKITVENCAC
jgi:hypothetical protein